MHGSMQPFNRFFSAHGWPRNRTAYFQGGPDESIERLSAIARVTFFPWGRLLDNPCDIPLTTPSFRGLESVNNQQLRPKMGSNTLFWRVSRRCLNVSALLVARLRHLQKSKPTFASAMSASSRFACQKSRPCRLTCRLCSPPRLGDRAHPWNVNHSSSSLCLPTS